MRKLAKLKKPAAFLALAVIIISLFAVSYLRLLDSYELEMLDLRFRLRPRLPTTDDFVIIEIGEDTIRKLGRFPFDRSYHAVLVSALADFGAKEVIFDFFFSEPHASDGEFEDAIRSAGNVYLPYVLELDTKHRKDVTVATGFIARCLDRFTALAKGQGHINIIPDIDGKFRRIPPLVKQGDVFRPYISVLAACNYLGIAEKDIVFTPGKSLRLGSDIRIPLDDHSDMMINYAGSWGKSYHHYSYVDVLQSYLSKVVGEKPYLDPACFKDKVCVIGLTATGTVDIHPNPFETLAPGMGIHAEVFNSIVTRRFIARVSRGGNLAILVFVMALVALATLKLKPVKALGALLAAAVLYAGIAVALFSLGGIWIDVIYPVFAMGLVFLALTIHKYISEWKRRLFFERELDIAKKIQESFLPKTVPETGFTDIAAAMFTARQVGGDIYDFLAFDGGLLGLMIGDVSGKGIPASLFMAMVAGSFKFYATAQAAPKDVLFHLNDKLSRESNSNLFVTMYYAVFNNAAKTFAYANGGHLPALHLPVGKEPVFLDVDEGAPLALMPGGYSGRETSFAAGDVFVFYTDGVTEAMNPRGEMYEKERLQQVALANRTKPAAEIVAAIEKDVRKFEPKPTQHDDITIIVVKIV